MECCPALWPPPAPPGMEWSAMMVWYGMVWYVMVWYVMVWYGMVWYGMVWYGMLWYGMVWCGMVCYGMVWYSIPTYITQDCNHWIIRDQLRESQLWEITHVF